MRQVPIVTRKPQLSRGLLGVCLLLLTLPVIALDPTRAVTQYARKHWQVEDGLPQNYVTSIIQERSGLLVVGTSGGVARFDGLRFQPIILDEASGISREWITSLAEDAANNLWISSRDTGIYLQQGGRTRPLPSPEVRFDSAIVRQDNTIAGMGPGLWSVRNGTLQQLQQDHAVDLSWNSLLELPDGRLLVCTSKGLYVYRGDRRQLWLETDQTHGTPISLHRGHSGRVYLGTTKGIYEIDTSFQGRASAIPGVNGSVVSIVEDRDGQVWAATWGNGLYRVNNGKVEQITDTEILPDRFVHALHEDTEGSLWIGTRVGLSRWKSGPIVPYGPPEGLSANYLSVVAGDGKQGLWIGSWRSGTHHYSQGGFAPQDIGSDEGTTLIRSIAPAPDGSLWCAEWYRLTHLSAKERTSYDAEQLGHSSNVEAILFDRSQRMWLATSKGLYVYDQPSVESRRTDLLPNQRVRTLLEDRKGRMWVGSMEGLSRIDDGHVVEIQGLPQPMITALFEDSRGRVWATTRVNGLVWIDGDTPRVFDQRHGLPALPIYAMQEDNFGIFWLTSPAGLFSVSMAALDALLAGERTRLDSVVYGPEDGLRTIEFQNVGFPNSSKDTAGDLWFASVNGLVRVRPQPPRQEPPPKVLLLEHRSQGRSNELRFTADQLGSTVRTQFRYQVENLYKEWIVLGGERSLRLDSLPAGRHHVRIAARQQGGAWGDPISLWITQPPRWFETWWFYTLCLLFAAAVVFAVYRWRMRSLRARYALVTEERNRIGREWHDTLLAGFSAISWQLDAALKSLGDRSEPTSDAIRIAGDMLRHYRTEARRVIWDLRRSTPEQENLPQAIERTLSEMALSSDLKTEIRSEGKATALDPELAQSVLRICQEAVLNAARHADPRNLRIHLAFTGAQLEASVTDDGKGFDPLHVERGHFGLAIMRERASRWGGKVEVLSERGKGTTVRATLPLQGGSKA